MRRREVIDQEGDWELIRTNPASAWESWVTHECQQSAFNHVAVSAGSARNLRKHYASCHTTQDCPICDEKIPERLIALWTLHNFDAIQRNSSEPWRAAL